MRFEKEKRSTLSRKDYSKKGCVDEQILPLVNTLNYSPNYYTTSSCSGRIVLIQVTYPTHKSKAKWLLVSHTPITLASLASALNHPPKRQVWLKYEPSILHVCCRTLESAQQLVDKAKFAGLKRSGIMSTRKRIMVELASTEQINTLASQNNKLLLPKPYLALLAKELNKKLAQNKKKLVKLGNNI